VGTSIQTIDSLFEGYDVRSTHYMLLHGSSNIRALELRGLQAIRFADYAEIPAFFRFLKSEVERLSGPSRQRPAEQPLPAGVSPARLAYVLALDRPEEFAVLESFEPAKLQEEYDRLGDSAAERLAQARPNPLWEAWTEVTQNPEIEPAEEGV
jgi:hypothetical protein